MSNGELSKTKEQDSSNLKNVEILAHGIVKKSKKPLFVMYYPSPGSEIREADIKDIREEFHKNKIVWRKGKLKQLNVLIHTYGGSPGAAYKVAQLLRDLSDEITILIPYYSYSAGTVISLCAEKIRFGAQANLSPIDIHYPNIELINIDYYMEFVKDCRKKIELALIDLEKELGFSKSETCVEEILLSKLAEQLGTITIGKFYRERTLTGHYAERLMDDYMFKNYSDKEERRDKIIRELLFSAPAHDFQVDFHIAKNMMLPVEEMTSEEFIDTSSLIDNLINAFKQEIICPYVKEDYHLPFFRLYL